jgi:hypothetical protein
MALTSREGVGKAIEQLREGLKQLIERELAAVARRGEGGRERARA